MATAQFTVTAVTTTHSTTVGYGFNINGKRGQPVVMFSYATEEHAKAARALMEKAVVNLVSATPGHPGP